MSIQRKKIQRVRILSIIEFIICNTDYRVYEVHVKYILDLLKTIKNRINRNFGTDRHTRVWKALDHLL